MISAKYSIFDIMKDFTRRVEVIGNGASIVTDLGAIVGPVVEGHITLACVISKGVQSVQYPDIGSFGF